MIDRERAGKIYLTMRRIRAFEFKAVNLFENNKLRGSVHLYIGQEAIAATICSRLTDEDYIFLAYNMNGKTLPAGKHAIMKLGDKILKAIRLSDKYGQNVGTEPGNVTSINDMSVSNILNSKGIYNLNGQKVAGKAEDINRLPHGVYIVNGQKIVK